MLLLSFIVNAVIFEEKETASLFWDSDVEASFLHFDALLFECLAAIGKHLPFLLRPIPTGVYLKWIRATSIRSGKLTIFFEPFSFSCKIVRVLTSARKKK